MNSKNAATTNDPTKAAIAATRSGAERRARNEYTTAIGVSNRKTKNIGKLDGRELSPLSMKAQAKAATNNKTTPTQPRSGARRDTKESATPTLTAAKPRTCNVRKDVMAASYAERKADR
jgi:hypothetical protein